VTRLWPDFLPDRKEGKRNEEGHEKKFLFEPFVTRHIKISATQRIITKISPSAFQFDRIMMILYAMDVPREGSGVFTYCICLCIPVKYRLQKAMEKR